MAATLHIDSRILACVDDLSLVARTVVEGFLDGLHRSPFLGYSTEFSTYRAYTQGDSLRYIDWKVWGRTDEFYVKQFEDDTNLHGQIFLDTSASMDFGAGAANKFDYGRILAAVLAELMVRQHDAPGLILLGENVRQALPTQASRHHSDEILQLLTHAQAGGRTRFDDSLLHLIENMSRRGMAVIISDFFTAPEATFTLLRQLQAQRQETLVFHLLAPEELDFPYDGDCLFEDSETGEEMPVHSEEFRREYQLRLAQFCARLKAECVRFEADYEQFRTDAPLEAALTAYLERRGAV